NDLRWAKSNDQSGPNQVVKPSTLRNPPVSRVGRIEKVGVDLEALPLADFHALQQSEVEVVNAVGPQDIAAGVADGILNRGRAEQGASTRGLYLPHAHTGKIQLGVEERPDGSTHQVAEHHAARVRAIQHAERSAGLEREEPIHLPPSQSFSYGAFLGVEHRQFEHAV